MGGKAGKHRGAAPAADVAAFVGAVPDIHRGKFEKLRRLIKRVAPQADESIKWGTIQYELNGSLFALSAAKKHVSLYILTIGTIAKHKRLLAGIPQSNCVLKFGPDLDPPIAKLQVVMKAALATKLG